MNNRSYFRVWEIDDKDGVAIVKMSTSRKLKENDYDANLAEKGIAKKGYVSTTWSFVRFIGKAYNQLAKHREAIENGTSITNVDFIIEQEPYYGEQPNAVNDAINVLEKAKKVKAGVLKKETSTYGVVYPKNIKITVFSFELVGENEEVEEKEIKPVVTKPIKNLDKAPKVEKEEYELDEEDLIVDEVVEDEEIEDENEEEMPF